MDICKFANVRRQCWYIVIVMLVMCSCEQRYNGMLALAYADARTLESMYDMAEYNLQKGECEKAISIINDGLQKAEASANVEYRFKFMMQKSRYLTIKREFISATKELEQLQGELGDMRLAYYMRNETKFDYGTWIEMLFVYAQMQEQGYDNTMQYLSRKEPPTTSLSSQIDLDKGIIYFISGNKEAAETMFMKIASESADNETKADAKYLLNGLRDQRMAGYDEFYSNYLGEAMPVYRFVKRMEEREIVKPYSLLEWDYTPEGSDPSKWKRIPVLPSNVWKNREHK